MTSDPLEALLARICEPGPATKWLMSERVTKLLAQFRAEDEAEREVEQRAAFPEYAP